MDHRDVGLVVPYPRNTMPSSAPMMYNNGNYKIELKENLKSRRAWPFRSLFYDRLSLWQSTMGKKLDMILIQTEEDVPYFPMSFPTDEP
jgi:hypothetical protein